MKKILIVVSILFVIFVAIVYFLKINITSNLKSYLTNEQKQIIKKYLFPYKLIDQLEYKLTQNSKLIDKLEYELDSSIYKELEFKKKKSDIRIIKDIKLKNGKTLKVFNLTGGFYSGIHEKFNRSGYIDFHKDNLFILSSYGTLAFSKDIFNETYFRQVSNNINDFIGIKQFKKHIWYSLKDLLIEDDKIFISFTEEIIDNCWNTSLIYGEINYEKINFKKLFTSEDCIDSRKEINSEFNAHQSGGRIVKYDKDHVLLTVGDYRRRYLAQDKNSINGKIIKINIKNSKYEIISMGHRNPQGLYFDKEKNIILETEHGPMGGDEINLIQVSKINDEKIQNYGWAVVSAGEHYGGKVKKNDDKYKKYPLYKSHSKHGFIEPLKTFVPSIAISEIVKIAENKYAFGSMGKDREGDMSIYFFDLNNENKIQNLQKYKVFERIRDLKFKNGKLYLFLESTGSIGVISLK